jgi:hypothetical protein
MSKETLGIVLAVVVGVVGFAIWMADKYGKATPVLTFMVLLLMAGLCLCGVYLIPWLWTAPTKWETVFRVSSATMLVFILIGQFGFWLTQPGGKAPEKEPSVSISPPLEATNRDSKSEFSASGAPLKKYEHPIPTHHVGEGFIQIYPTVKDASTLLQENEKVVFVANYVNRGQEPVNSFLPFASLMPIGAGTDVSDISSKAVWNKFHEQSREYENQHPNRKGDSIGPGDNWQIAVESQSALNRTTIDAVRSGKIKILLVARAQWKTVDGIKGEIESCFVLIPPEQKNAAQLTWSSCDSL